MANTGILASETFNSLTYTSVYSPTADTFAVVTVSICNKNTNPIRIRLAAAIDPNIPDVGQYLEYETEILPNGVLERTGVILEAGRTLWAYSTGPTGSTNSDASNTDVVIYGIETSTA